MECVDAIVVGAGVVGLAIARRLSQLQREVIVLESEDSTGSGISARNSEVIHAGIYYPGGSLKAQLCVAGKRALYQYCVEHSVDHKRCGKLIVATSAAEQALLLALERTASENGVQDLTRLGAEDITALEPEVVGVAGLLSPSTGIVDSHGLMLSLQANLEDAGGVVALRTRVSGLRRRGSKIEVLASAPENVVLSARTVIVSAGLGTQAILQNSPGFDRNLIPPLILCKGNYFMLSGLKPFSRLVYPLPEKHGLGIHATLDQDGNVRFGPDTQWVSEENYNVDPARAGLFYQAVRTYYPGLPDNSLQPGYAGIRPKTATERSARQDFRIAGPAQHGWSGLIALFGIESPGLTSCLAIAENVSTMATL